MYVPDEPHFRPGWFRFREPSGTTWMADEKWVPPGAMGLYGRARSGLWVIAREKFPAGATVLLPAYVPRSVVQSFRSGDVAVHYYPVDPDLRLPRGEVQDRIEAVDPDAVVFVHYFGFADPAFDDLVAAARSVGATVIEDCSRGLFSRDTDGTLLGATGEYALFSLHKVLPVPNGGLVVAHDPEESFPAPETARSEYRDAVVAILLSAFEAVGVPPATLNGSAPDVRSEGDASSSMRDVDMQSSIGDPGWLSRIGFRATDPPSVVAARRRRYAEVREALAALDGVDVLTPGLHDGACPFGVAVRFPDGVETRDRVYERLHGAGLPSQRLRWRLRPDEQEPDSYPGARMLRRQLLVVPTHHQIPRGIDADIAEAVVDAIDP